MNTSSPEKPTTDFSSSLIPFALANLGRPGLVRKASMAIAAWQFGKMVWQTWNRLNAKATPEVIIYSNQPIYAFALLWLSQQEIIPERNERSFFVSVVGGSRADECIPISPEGESVRQAAKIALTPASNVKFRWRGHVISCQNEKGQAESSDRWQVDKLTLRMADATESLLIAMMEDIDLVGRELSTTKREPWVHYYRWHWNRLRRCSDRCAILPAGQYEAILADIRRFQASREWYESVGIPHRRGFLFKGIPGSGKTSAALAIAAALEMHIYWINLSSMTDEDLLQAMGSVGERDILLIEDADCVSATATRETDEPDCKPSSDQSKCTLGGLLNAIDGVATPDGRVLIMTTNHPERLDPALIRPGRIDVQVDFTHATADQIANLAARFGCNGDSESIGAAWSRENLSMAEVKERLIQKQAVNALVVPSEMT